MPVAKDDCTKWYIHVPYCDIEHHVKPNTMLGVADTRLVYELAIAADVLDGCVAEAGVAMGGIVYMLARVMRFKIIYGFDSWMGLPKATVHDTVTSDKWLQRMGGELALIEGWGCRALLSDETKTCLAGFGSRVKLHAGWFHDTLQVASHESFCLVHLDADRYDSTLECLEFFWPRMVPGGFIMVDDYNFPLTPGVTKATDDFFSDKDYDVMQFGNKPIIVSPRRQ